MKISNLLVFAVLFSLLTMSCDNEEPIPVLEGDWALTSLETELLTTKDSAGITTLITTTEVASDISLEIGFAKGPNMFNSSGSYDLTSTVDIDGTITTEEYEDVTFGFNGGTWAKIATAVTISKDGDITAFEIKELTETTLVLRYYAVGQYWDNDVAYDIEQTGDYTFSRL